MVVKPWGKLWRCQDGIDRRGRWNRVADSLRAATPTSSTTSVQLELGMATSAYQIARRLATSRSVVDHQHQCGYPISDGTDTSNGAVHHQDNEPTQADYTEVHLTNVLPENVFSEVASDRSVVGASAVLNGILVWSRRTLR
jgi:hypothetical protein